MDVNVGAKQGGICDLLCEHIDEVVVICTESCCFTGLLCSIHCGVVKIITRHNQGCPSCCCSSFGKVTVIPVNEIVAVTLCNTGF